MINLTTSEIGICFVQKIGRGIWKTQARFSTSATVNSSLIACGAEILNGKSPIKGSFHENKELVSFNSLSTETAIDTIS